MTNDWLQIDADNKEFYDDGGRSKRHQDKINHKKGVKQTNNLFKPLLCKLKNKYES